MRFPLAIIKVNNLTKTFVTTEKQPGMQESIRALFRPVRREVQAVKDITFTVEEGERLAFKTVYVGFMSPCQCLGPYPKK